MKVVITAIVGIVTLVGIAAATGHDGYMLAAGLSAVSSICAAWIAYKKGHKKGYETAKVILQTPRDD